jgi:hypothetical protein
MCTIVLSAFVASTNSPIGLETASAVAKLEPYMRARPPTATTRTNILCMIVPPLIPVSLRCQQAHLKKPNLTDMGLTRRKDDRA